MKYVTKPFKEQIYSSSVLDFYFSDMKKGTLDIETTGLDPSKNKFILGGLCSFGSKQMRQVFAQSRTEERDAIERFIHEMSQLDMVITYNGRHFDIPFIEKRFTKFFDEKLSMPYNLDLYLVLNGHSPIKKFVPNLKQKTVENYMGPWQSRTDEISGAESVELYNTYEKTGREDLESKILLHNSDDVIQLTRLLKVISKSDFHKAMFCLGFPTGPLTVNKISFQRDFMTVSGIQRNISINYIGFEFKNYPVEIHFDSNKSAFSLKFPLIKDKDMLIADLDAAGIDSAEFEKYPNYGSGFIVLKNNSGINYMETNHFVKNYIRYFLGNI